MQENEGFVDAADRIVNSLGPIQGDDDIVERFGDFSCVFAEQQAGRQ